MGATTHRIQRGAPVRTPCSTRLLPVRTAPLLEIERLLSVREVAAAFGMSIAIVYRLASTGELTHVRVANSIRFGPEDVRAYVVCTKVLWGGQP